MKVSGAIDPHQLPLGAGVTLLHADASGLLAVEKPAGVRSHPNHAQADSKALLSCSYCQETEAFMVPTGEAERVPVFLLNRLDGPTSGVLLLATDAALAAAVKEAFATRAVSKSYCALVRGRPVKPMDTWLDKLRKHRQEGKVRASVGRSEGVSASTRMRLGWTKGMNPTVSLLHLQPLTGRTHQLRVQCALRHLPILGDATYGDFNLNRRMHLDRLFLHAAKVQLTLPWQGKTLQFSAESPLPPEFRKLANSL